MIDDDERRLSATSSRRSEYVGNSNIRWRPKVTLYRLLVLSTTIVLGSAKAVAVYLGKSYVSTTIELITGVVLFNLFFVIGWFEEDSSRYPKLAWLVDCDLIPLLFTTPVYTSEERQKFKPGPYDIERHPPITGYHILVSGVVFIFGMLKAYLSYDGLGGAANTVDWILGVVVTSAIYVLGLYENNPRNMMPYLFETGYNDYIYSTGLFISEVAQLLTGMTVFMVMAWSYLWYLQQFRMLYNDTPWKPFFYKLSVMATCVMTGVAIFGMIGYSLYCLWGIVSAFGRLSLFRKLAKLLRHLYLWAWKRMATFYASSGLGRRRRKLIEC